MSNELFDITIKGDKELVRQLNLLPDKFFKRTVKRAVVIGNRHLLKKTKEKAPVSKKDPNDARRGLKLLRKSLAGKVVRFLKDGVWHGMVSANIRAKGTPKGQRAPFSLIHLLEFGHRIAPRIKGTRLLRTNLDRVGRGGRITKRKQEVNTVKALGFVQPHKFMIPGIKAARPTVIKKMAAEIRTGLDKAIKEMATKVNKA